MKWARSNDVVQQYPRTFPEVAQWISYCRACDRFGVLPETPWEELKIGFQHFIYVQRLALLPVSDIGLCEQCAAAAARLSPDPGRESGSGCSENTPK